MSILDDLMTKAEQSSRFTLRPFVSPIRWNKDECIIVDAYVRTHPWEVVFGRNGGLSKPPSIEILDGITLSILSFLAAKKMFSAEKVQNRVISIKDVGDKAREIDKKVRRVNSDLQDIAAAINHLFGFQVSFNEMINELNFWHAYTKDGRSAAGTAGTRSDEPLNNVIAQLALVYEAHSGEQAPWRLTGGEVRDEGGPFLRLIESCLAIAGDDTPKNKVIEVVRWVLQPKNVIKKNKSITADSSQ
jgi:hypothetical protein